MCKCFLRGWSENQIEKHPQQRIEKPRTSEKKNQHLEKSFGEENNFVILLANIVRSADIQLRAPKSRPPDVLIHVNTKAHWEAVTCYLLLSIECLQLQSQPPSNRGGEKRRKSIKSPSGKEKRDILPETRGAGDFSLDVPTQNTFDSYKMFLTGVDSIIFPPKSRDHSCLERRQVIDYSV